MGRGRGLRADGRAMLLRQRARERGSSYHRCDLRDADSCGEPMGPHGLCWIWKRRSWNFASAENSLGARQDDLRRELLSYSYDTPVPRFAFCYLMPRVIT